MEPTKNTNNNNGNGGSFEPAFHGMPKPGQSLASTPRVEPQAPAPSQPRSQTSPQTQTQAQPKTNFSAHTPSALDRIMNPNAGAAVPPPVSQAPQPVSTPAASMPSQTQSSTPSTSGFKPYTPPQSNVAASQSSFSATQTSTTFSKPVSTPAPSNFTSPSFGAPKVGNPVSSNNFSNSIPPSPSATVTSSKLSNEVNSILNSKPTEPAKHKNTLMLIIGAVILLLILVGGGYYWYAFMRTPGQTEDVQNAGMNSDTANSSASRPASSFPSGVTQPNTARPSTATTPTKPTTSAKVTRVTTPFNSTQRAIVGSYISTHINELAPTKSNIPYEVTDITFDGPDRAIVQYTNGQSSYAAIAVASIDTADNVRIMSFTLLDK